MLNGVLACYNILNRSKGYEQSIKKKTLVEKYEFGYFKHFTVKTIEYPWQFFILCRLYIGWFSNSW
jgi:hypothetical protein